MILAQFIVGCDRNNVVGICMVGLVATVDWSRRVALCSILVFGNESSLNLLLYNVGTTQSYGWGNHRFGKTLLFCTSSLFLNCSILTLHFSSSKLFTIWQSIDLRYDSDAIYRRMCCCRRCIYQFKRLSQIHWNIYVHHVLILPD